MRSSIQIAAATAAMLTSCSLFVSLDGLSGGSGGSASCDAGECGSGEGGSEAGSGDGGGGADAATTYTYNDITDIANWDSFDLHGYILDDAGDFPGFIGGVSDGQYVYFTPFQVGYTGNNFGLVLRYDTTKSFTDSGSWASFDTTALDPNAVAYGGQGFDGKYVYFVPGYSSVTVRYDTTADFSNPASWSKIDLGPLGSNTASAHAFPVGKYVYYSPRYDYMFRYDTTLPFDQSSSWVGVDPVSLSGATSYNFGGAAFDGASLILFPNTSAPPCDALRFDTTQQIASTSAWAAFDLAQLDASTLPSFERDAVFDGRYAYGAPAPPGATSIVERYDTQAPFTTSSSWSDFDLTANLGVTNDDGFGAFDGRYMYVVNYQGQTLVRFDTQSPFESTSSWQAFVLTALPGDATFGFGGSVFDGQYLFLVPRGSGSIYRFHARTPAK